MCIRDSSNAKRLITTQAIYERLTTHLSVTLGANKQTRVDFWPELTTVKATDRLAQSLILDDALVQAELATFSNASISNIDRIRLLTPQNLAYLIYTSGTTGKPKAVTTPHQAAVNFLCGSLSWKETVCSLHNASVAFDASVLRS